MSLLKSVDDLVCNIETSQCPYVVIGGIAVLLHGGRASTIDFDFYILAGDFERLKTFLVSHGAVVDLETEHQIRFKFAGIQVDCLEADSVLSKTIFARAMRMKIVNTACNVATPEDLIILKTLADRPIDRRDVAELREIFAESLDEVYIVETLKKYL